MRKRLEPSNGVYELLQPPEGKSVSAGEERQSVGAPQEGGKPGSSFGNPRGT
jgi:hypothetical protein